MKGIIELSDSAKECLSEPSQVFFSKLQTPRLGHTLVFSNQKVSGWEGSEMCYFIKLHGDAEVPTQVKTSALNQTYI